MRPTAATVAVLEPEIAPISVQAPTVATPRLPGTRPISASTQAISRSAMPAAPISSPAKMKNGIASSA